MSINQVETMTNRANKIYAAVDEALRLDWNRKDNLQFPNLLKHVMDRLKASAEEATQVDLYVRDFVRQHPDYKVSRGAKGGIMLASVFEARLSKKAEREVIKEEIKAQIDAKVAEKSVVKED